VLVLPLSLMLLVRMA